MTEQEAHDQLHQILPKGSTVTLSRTQFSRSVVGAGPTVHGTDGDWHVTVTVPNEVDHVEAAFGSVLEEVVADVIHRVQSLPVHSKPPKLASPSSIFDEVPERRQIS